MKDVDETYETALLCDRTGRAEHMPDHNSAVVTKCKCEAHTECVVMRCS